MILFTPEMAEKILAGEKTETRRRHKIYLRLGAVHQVRSSLFGGPVHCLIRILDRTVEEYPGHRYSRDLLWRAAAREGFDSWQAFRDWWADRYGEAALKEPCKWYRFEVLKEAAS